MHYINISQAITVAGPSTWNSLPWTLDLLHLLARF